MLSSAKCPSWSAYETVLPSAETYLQSCPSMYLQVITLEKGREKDTTQQAFMSTRNIISHHISMSSSNVPWNLNIATNMIKQVREIHDR